MEGLTKGKLSSWDVTAMKSIFAKLHFWSITEWKGKSVPIRENNPCIKKESSEFENVPISKTTHEDSLAYPNCDLGIWLRTCETEVITPMEGVATGVIPSWINGRLFQELLH